jgi:hypothetical protein
VQSPEFKPQHHPKNDHTNHLVSETPTAQPILKTTLWPYLVIPSKIIIDSDRNVCPFGFVLSTASKEKTKEQHKAMLWPMEKSLTLASDHHFMTYVPTSILNFFPSLFLSIQ